MKKIYILSILKQIRDRILSKTHVTFYALVKWSFYRSMFCALPGYAIYHYMAGHGINNIISDFLYTFTVFVVPITGLAWDMFLYCTTIEKKEV
ncbi:MAG: hypothetical protein LBI18_01125 [Planctomycetaceae bacterium]|nr:hypothetical protein [Planctomycetaceae bacterium]